MLLSVFVQVYSQPLLCRLNYPFAKRRTEGRIKKIFPYKLLFIGTAGCLSAVALGSGPDPIYSSTSIVQVLPSNRLGLKDRLACCLHCRIQFDCENRPDFSLFLFILFAFLSRHSFLGWFVRSSHVPRLLCILSSCRNSYLYFHSLFPFVCVQTTLLLPYRILTTNSKGRMCRLSAGANRRRPPNWVCRYPSFGTR